MADHSQSLGVRIEKAREELQELKAYELKSNVMVLYKDKEIAKLKEELSDIQSQIKANKSAYTKNNIQSAVLHPLINSEFELLKDEITDVHEKISTISMENFFKKQSEGSNSLSDLLGHVEQCRSTIKSDISTSGLEKLESQLRKKTDYLRELETRIQEIRELVLHYQEEIDSMQNSISYFQSKLNKED